MSSPDQEHKSDSTSLDAERARHRSAGYTDAEISHILTQREIGASPSQPAQGAAPSSGVLSGALSSLVAVAAHARTYIIGTKADLATLFANAATPATRARAGGSLILKAVIVAVLGYAALQEWRIHIGYNPELAHQQLIKAEADARIAQGQAAQAAHIPTEFEYKWEQQAARDAAPATTAASNGTQCLRVMVELSKASPCITCRLYFTWIEPDGLRPTAENQAWCLAQFPEYAKYGARHDYLKAHGVE
jgi:hypothetical protein